MEPYDNLSDTELLYRLRVEYLQAMQLQDFNHINGVIVPRFWGRFAKYHDQYARSWRAITTSNPTIQVLINPDQQKKMDLDWMDQVLRGQIEIGI